MRRFLLASLALSLALAGCGQRAPGPRSAPSATTPRTTALDAPATKTAPASAAPASTRRSTAGVTRLARRASTSCVDRAVDRRVVLPRALAKLPPALRNAQRALRVAQRTYRRLLVLSRTRGPRYVELAVTAKLRRNLLLRLNYALERHDPAALRVAEGATSIALDRLRSDARRAGAAGCR